MHVGGIKKDDEKQVKKSIHLFSFILGYQCVEISNNSVYWYAVVMVV